MATDVTPNRRRVLQASLVAANRKFAEAQALAPTGDSDARQRAQEALIEARLARKELAALETRGGGSLRPTTGVTR